MVHHLAEVATLTDLLTYRHQNRSGGGYTCLRDGTSPVAQLSFAELARRSRSIAATVQGVARPGARALLLFPSGVSFLPAFFACLEAGVIAVPLPLPEGSRLKHSVPRLVAVAQDAQPSLAITIDAALPDLRDRLSNILPRLHWIGTETAVSELTNASWRPPPVGEDDIAYLQYTSGSTGRPRGVMISHANVLANLSHLRSAFGYDSDSVAVTWLPHFHDYGLVEGLLQPLFSDIPCYVLSPLTFLKRPLRWLQAISRFRATHSHGPNFAYELCSTQPGIAEANLALSSWRMAGNGAEPIRAATLRRFTRTFAASGFSADAFYPAYGLAEITLFASARRPKGPWVSREIDSDALEKHYIVPAGAAVERKREIVSCGVPQGTGRILIVDPETRCPCEADRVGEIWLADRSVGCGYWKDQAMSEAVFRARLAGNPNEGPFLRTGDLGFVRDGELYITGRLKDLVIVAGVNHYPQDIEWTVLAAAPEFRRNHCVVFAAEQCDGEELVVVAEAADRAPGIWEGVLQRVRRAVLQEHELDPAVILVVGRGKIPKTSSGKLQRAASKQAWQNGGLPAIAAWQRSRKSETTALPSVELEDWLRLELARELSLTPDEISVRRPIAEYGVNSRLAVDLMGRLEQRLGGRELSPTLLWEYPTIAAICSHLVGAAEVVNRHNAVPTTVAAHEPIAIVGLACRFPGAPTAAAYWSLLRNGRNGLGTSPRLPGVIAGFIPEVAYFDARFFGVSEPEAQVMDPQQQLLLEVAWEALEDAGISADQLRGQRGGVFVGISAVDFACRSLGHRAIGAHTAPGVALSIASNRLSYALDLTGPSMSIDTACSSSLVAVHQACRALRGGECDFALAGGVNVLLSPNLHRALADGGMLSPSSLCRTFDVDADGYVRGEGCGVVVLKPISVAARDGDPVWAIIRGSAVNQDGRSNGLTAPNPAAQAAVIRAALADARLPPSAIDYAEAHGTGTPLGDPIEIRALLDALGTGRSPDDRCFIGSVKTNIGHLEAGAGIAGLIKTVLALRHREIPPHINLTRINPLIELGQTPFAIPIECSAWSARKNAEPRRACVSSFGFGGTNAQVVLEQAPDTAASEVAEPWPFVISARSVPALRALAKGHVDRLEARPAPVLSSYCATLATGRAALPERFAMVASDRAALVAGLRDFAAGELDACGYSGRAPNQRPGIGFVFSGQGGQYAGMARRLYSAEPVFRQHLDACEAMLGDYLGYRLLRIVFDDNNGLLDRTEYTHPALFALEYALARSLMHWGVKPDALLGHSFGEYVAACIAGVFDLSDAFRLVTARGQLMQQLAPPGAMLAVAASEAELSAAIQDYVDLVSIAAVNAPRSCMLSGDPQTLLNLRSRFEHEGVRTRPLSVSHSFHSPLVDPVLEAFCEAASRINFAVPSMKIISNLDGAAMTVAPDAEYWTRHLRRTVRFADGLATLAQSCSVILEIGPQPLAVSVATECISDREVTVMPTLRRDVDDVLAIREAFAHLHVCGVTLDWQRFYGDRQIGRMNGVPTYPFERRHFPLPPAEPFASPQPDVDVFDHDSPISLQTNWQATAEPVAVAGNGHWLLLGNGDGWGEALAGALATHGRKAEVVTWAPNTSADKIVSLLERNDPPEAVVFLGGIDIPLPNFIRPDDALAVIRNGLTPALALAQSTREPTQLWLMTRQAQAVASADRLAGLFQTPIWGFGRGVALERPGIFGGLLDLPDGPPLRADVEVVAALVCASRQDKQYAVRDGRLFAPRLRRAPALSGEPPGIVAAASYLVTGGFGDVGRMAVRALIGAGAQHIWVVTRSGGTDGRVAELMAELNGQIDLRSAALDVADSAGLTRQIDAWEAVGPPLRGIIHAAGLVGRTKLEALSWRDIETLVRPKVQGTWALANAVAGRRLDFFVCCSSVAALWGGRGQAAYAAANTFLDGFASYRAALGLSAVSVALGPIRGTRMVSEDIVAELSQFGLHAMPLDPIGRMLLSVPSSAGPNLSIVSVDLNRFPMLHGARSPSGLFDELTGDARPREIPEKIPSSRLFGKGPILAWLTAQVAAALHLPEQDVDPNRPLAELGLDSLTAMELRNRAKRRLNVTLPLHDLLGNRGLAWLAEYLAASTPTSAAAEVPVWVEGVV